jgi:pimeloyl-ACP methyl ester carboxylesterase
MNRRKFLQTTLLPLALQSASSVFHSGAFAQAVGQGGGTMGQPTQRIIEANNIRINIAEEGSGPLVLLCHGFPESWYSWRHQLGALAAAGFHAVAPDMRGYGKSDRPEAIDQYTIFHLVGDLIGVLDALDARSAVVVGHDVGSSVAWQAAQMRPDRVRAVVGLSVPFRPRATVRPTSAMPRTADSEFYVLYFQNPGVAEAEFESDPRSTLRNMLFGASGEGVVAARAAAVVSGVAPNLAMVPRGAAPAHRARRSASLSAAASATTALRADLLRDLRCPVHSRDAQLPEVLSPYQSWHLRDNAHAADERGRTARSVGVAQRIWPRRDAGLVPSWKRQPPT